jgi:hypothetical protein
MKSFSCMLSKRWNRFLVCSACNEIVSLLAQHAIGYPCKNCQNLHTGWEYTNIFFHCFLVCSASDEIVSVYALQEHALFSKITKKINKMPFLTINNQNFKNCQGTYLKDQREHFLIPLNKILVLENVWISKFWQRSKEKNQKNFLKLTKGI